MKTRKPALATNQEGFAAIVIAIVLVLVLSLMTTGFAELMRHEQTRALDRQLSSQAYYAAETGVNDAVKALNAGYNAKKTNCAISGLGGVDNSQPGKDALQNNNVGNNTGSSYSCLLIDPSPPTLEFNPIDTVHSHTVEVNGVDNSGVPAAIGNMTLSWHASNYSTILTPTNNCTSLPRADSWKGTGILRAQIVPIHVDAANNSDVNRTSLVSNSYTAYLCPTATAAALGFGDYNNHGVTKSGDIVVGSCNNGSCTATINNISAIPNSIAYTLILNLKSIYQANAVSIKINGTDGTPLHIAKAQAVVDSTGKAQDVLRRIQVRVPLASVYNYDTPDGTQAASSICKQLELRPSPNTSISAGGSDCTLP